MQNLNKNIYEEVLKKLANKHPLPSIHYEEISEKRQIWNHKINRELPGDMANIIANHVVSKFFEIDKNNKNEVLEILKNANMLMFQEFVIIDLLVKEQHKHVDLFNSFTNPNLVMPWLGEYIELTTVAVNELGEFRNETFALFNEIVERFIPKLILEQL
jgi:hypothetical protein